MNRLFRFLIVGFLSLFVFSVIAQPSIILNDATANIGEEVEVVFSVKDFANISTVDLSINWDINFLQFKEVSAVNPQKIASLDFDNLDESKINEGQLGLAWSSPAGLPDISPDDGTWFFKVIFQTVASGATSVTFSDNPIPLRIIRAIPGVSDAIFDLRDLEDDGTVTNGMIQINSDANSMTFPSNSASPVILNLETDSEQLPCAGEQICYTLKVENFDSIVGFDAPIFWDPTKLTFIGEQNKIIEQVTVSNNFGDGALLLLIDLSLGNVDQDLITNGISFEDSTSLVDLCFEVLAEQDNETLIEIGNTPLVSNQISIENAAGQPVDHQSSATTFESLNCDEVVIINTTCESGSEGEEVCVTVRASNFPEVSDFLYTHTWDADILEFVEVRSIISALSELQVDAGANNATISWSTQSTQGVDLPKNSSMYDICFRVKAGAQEGQASNVKINLDESLFSDINGIPFSDVRISDDCQIEIEAAPIPTAKLSLPDTTFINEGSTKCIDILVENFVNVDFVQFPLTWDDAVLRYTGKDNDRLDNINVRTVGTNEIIVEWESPNNPQTLADGSAMVAICFEAIGKASEQAISESALVFSGSEDILIARNNVPFPLENSQPGLVVLNEVPVSAVSLINEQTLDHKRGSQICVPVTVENFQDILSIRMLMTWDSTVLAFDKVQNFNDQFPLPIRALDFTSPNKGQLNFIWFDAANFTPVSVDNGQPLFDICFEAVGDLGDCTRLEFPASIQTAGGLLTTELINASSQEELNIIDGGKNICITPFGIEDEIVLQPDCSGDGSIEVQLTGGTGYFGTWEFFRNGVRRTSDENATLPDNTLKFDLIGSDIDRVCLSVFNISNFDQFEDRCWTVEVSDNRIPIAFAGEDRETGCGGPNDIAVELTGDWSFGDQDTMLAGGVIDFSWAGLQGGVIDPFQPNGRTATATSAGKYVLTVEVTATGCKAQDTVEVFQSSLPEISVNDIENITCTNEQVTLVGEGVETGPEYQYEWRTDAGEVLESTVPFEAQVSQGGVYIFRVENATSGCANEERLTVLVDKEPPRAEAGRNLLKRCEDRFVELDGTGSAVGARIAYEWSTENGSQIFDFTGQTPNVSTVGTYFIEVTDIDNGCTSTDSMRVEADPELPVALATPTAFIGCGDSPRATLDGSPTREFTNANFLYSWKQGETVLVEGRETSILDQTTVRDTGEYLLIIINTENDNCIADTAIVTVGIDDTKPAADVPTNLRVGCSDDCIDLPSNTDNTSGAFSYEWSTEDGFICEGENATTAKISTFGTYQLVLTNASNNCSDTTKVFVFPDEENNVGADAGAPKEINCQNDTVLLDGGGSSKEPSHSHEWRFDGEVISTELQVMVSEVGTYELIVKDSETGCVDNASVKVTENKDLPKVDAGDDIEFSACNFPTDPPLSLVATNSDSGEEFDIAWTTADGEITGDTNTVITTIGASGTYTLTITNKATGCSATDNMVVSSRIFTPVAIIEPVDQIDCNASMLTLDAQASDVDTNVEVEWTTVGGNIVSGENSLTPSIDAPGTYTLKLTAENGCEDRSEVVIMPNGEVPVVDVVMDNLRIFCNEQMTIDASGSSTGNNLVTSWTTTNGQIVSGANTLLPEIAAGGTYLLTIEDTVTNCKVTKEVQVESDGNLSLAQAGEDQEVCGQEAMLAATAPSDDVTGQWRAIGGGSIEADNEAATSVASLNPGQNIFVWTLSSAECPDYSIDTVMVNVATTPVATADDFSITNDQTSAQLNLIQNDQLSSSDIEVNLLSDLTNGSLTKVEEGVYEFSFPTSFLGRQQFDYEVCSRTCSDVCANATVTLAVRPLSLESLEEKPNAITPNGDGLNDLLIFDELFLEDFNNSELVVFNRWGDVIYRESPYSNDWQGTGSDGTAVPEGTYYYILRLNIGEGEIIRGEVTILR